MKDMDHATSVTAWDNAVTSASQSARAKRKFLLLKELLVDEFPSFCFVFKAFFRAQVFQGKTPHAHIYVQFIWEPVSSDVFHLR